MFVSGSKDSTLKVWDLRTRKLKVDLPGHADEVRPLIALVPCWPHFEDTCRNVLLEIVYSVRVVISHNVECFLGSDVTVHDV